MNPNVSGRTGDRTRTSGAAEPLSWKKIVAPYSKADTRRAVWQVLNSFVPYVALWVAMVWSLHVSYLLTLGLAVVAAGFLVRIFIIFHDCGHGSFLKSKRWRDVIGYVAGTLTFTPYHFWTHTHAIHHATAGNLEKRGLGDVWTMTAQEFRDASWHLKLRYWIVRNPLFMFTVGPIYMFLIHNRWAAPEFGRRWQISVQWANLGIAVLIAGLILTIGWKAYVMIQGPVIFFAGIGGIWLFYVQHNFEDVYWSHEDRWDYASVGLLGSSYYRLPKVLQWFSGNIGFHHIHHLSPKVPNYRLEACHRENPIFHRVPTIDLAGSLKCLKLRVWDEETGKMTGFREALATGRG